MSIKQVIAFVGIGVLGIGVGAASAGEQPAKATQTSVQEKIVEVEVPGPERVVEKKVEVPVVPQGCKDAIAAAEQVAGVSAEYADVSLAYVSLIPRAYESGVTLATTGDGSDAQAVISDIETNNERVNDLTSRLSPLVDAFNAGKATCN